MTEIGRSRRWRRRIIWAVGGFALLLVSGFAFLAAIGIHGRANNPTVRALTGVDSSTEPVTVTMGKVVLRIPRNYFLSMPSRVGRRDEPDPVAFILLGLMPDFEPRTAANRAEFDDFHGLA